jgi:hypothetical protein
VTEERGARAGVGTTGGGLVVSVLVDIEGG